MNLDITYCSGGDCPLRFDCLRYTAEHYGRYDCFGSVPYSAEKRECDVFMSNASQVNTTAYYLWQAAGYPTDSDFRFWFEAKEQLANKLK